MKLIIRNATIVDTESSFNKQTVDIQINGKTIEKIAGQLPIKIGYEELALENLHVSQGWFDPSVSFGEPGFEDRETIENGLYVAAKSGFTTVVLQPNSYPILDNQSQINFVRDRAKNSVCDLFPIGALTKASEGKDMAELYDMKNAGAVAFGDYGKSVVNANLLKIALQYVQDFDGLLLGFCQDESLKGNGVANEGIVSTQLGLKGIPTLAEEIIVARNLFLLEYTGGKMHIPTISSGKSVALIKDAKSRGLNVTCSVAVHHLVLTDNVLEGFDTRYKVSPPLQNAENQKALLQGVKEGTIDMITSDHNPIDIEHKKMEFDLAQSGTIGLESAFGALHTVLPLALCIEKLTAGKTIFRIKNQPIEENKIANLTLFNPDKKWFFSKDDILSKSKNSAFIGQKLKGKAYGIINNGKLVL